MIRYVVAKCFTYIAEDNGKRDDAERNGSGSGSGKQYQHQDKVLNVYPLDEEGGV